ncbi:MAG: PDGLE domain-containing protein [Methanomicrobiales archaeon]|nr:PDGLE domain-containing protein [Methanomicrobiales archaeon]
MIDKKPLIAGGPILAIFIGVFAVFFASGDPDGLESTALIIQGGKILTCPTPPDAEIEGNMEGKSAYSAPRTDYSLGEGSGPGEGILAIFGGNGPGNPRCHWRGICIKGSQVRKTYPRQTNRHLIFLIPVLSTHASYRNP